MLFRHVFGESFILGGVSILIPSSVDCSPEEADSCRISSASEGLMTGLLHILSASEIISARRSLVPNFFFFAACFTLRMVGTVRTSGVGSPSPSDLSGTGLVVVEAPALVSLKGLSEPRCDASELGSSLKPKGGEELAPWAGETSGTKPRKLAEPSSVLVSAVDILGEVLFAPEVARGMFRLFLKGTSSRISSVLAEGLFW